MNEHRWAVLEAADGDGWLVVHPGDIFRRDGRFDFWDVHSQHDTWGEAMKEADRMSRTVTVTLPAAHPQVPLMRITQSRGDQASFIGGGFVLTCCPDAGNLERIALEILAHARGGMPSDRCT